jgi:hypothetical protein
MEQLRQRKRRNTELFEPLDPLMGRVPEGDAPEEESPKPQLPRPLTRVLLLLLLAVSVPALLLGLFLLPLLRLAKQPSSPLLPLYAEPAPPTPSPSPRPGVQSWDTLPAL